MTPAGRAPAAHLVPVPAELLAADSVAVAPRLLNCLLAHGDRVVRIVEVEAYRGEEDPASHAYRGRTSRNGSMFGPPGRLYVYFTYGMHWCANVVCGKEGEARAVLLRAGAPVAGLAAIRAARPAARTDADLCSGPAKLCQALGIDRAQDGVDLLDGHAPVRLLSDGVPPPDRPGVGPRVGIRSATEMPWRWWVPGDPNVSAHRSRRGSSDSQ
ncbi:MAG TPA: DNA-3-methyladenine glycosylase [Acidimicrobiales bacterium]|nr:DNA-3-methyladenine glycosylase [Acidimicrobiales bacterium]